MTAPRPTAKVTPFLMFDDQLESAIAFYTATFPDSRITTSSRVGADGPIMSAEVDRYWETLVKAGAKPLQCGWITDPFGLTWQIVPRRFMALIADPDKVKAVMDAMLQMVKLDEVEEGTAYGTPALKVRGKLFVQLKEVGVTLGPRSMRLAEGMSGSSRLGTPPLAPCRPAQ